MSGKHREGLRAKYREIRDEINADKNLNYETKQRQIRAAGLQYDQEQAELEANWKGKAHER